jgi:hypothetical protein
MFFKKIDEASKVGFIRAGGGTSVFDEMAFLPNKC